MLLSSKLLATYHFNHKHGFQVRLTQKALKMSSPRPLRRKAAQAPALDAPPRVTFPSNEPHDRRRSDSIVENIFQDTEFSQYINLVDLYRKSGVSEQIEYPRVRSILREFLIRFAKSS
jgi:hypothetical protein